MVEGEIEMAAILVRTYAAVSFADRLTQMYENLVVMEILQCSIQYLLQLNMCVERGYQSDCLPTL